MRLQRRDFFRIETPRTNPLQFHARLPSDALLTLPAHDISVAGIGLSSGIDHALSPGIALGNCRFALPEDDHDVFLKAVVRHVTPHELRAGVTQWRIGLRFEGLPIVEENRLQRYIAQVEHERHELS
jgi:c-di-GMP-binding flagellar brake protein YcgR